MAAPPAPSTAIRADGSPRELRLLRSRCGSGAAAVGQSASSLSVSRMELSHSGGAEGLPRLLVSTGLASTDNPVHQTATTPSVATSSGPADPLPSAGEAPEGMPPEPERDSVPGGPDSCTASSSCAAASAVTEPPSAARLEGAADDGDGDAASAPLVIAAAGETGPALELPPWQRPLLPPSPSPISSAEATSATAHGDAGRACVAGSDAGVSLDTLSCASDVPASPASLSQQPDPASGDADSPAVLSPAESSCDSQPCSDQSSGGGSGGGGIDDVFPSVGWLSPSAAPSRDGRAAGDGSRSPLSHADSDLRAGSVEVAGSLPGSSAGLQHGSLSGSSVGQRHDKSRQLAASVSLDHAPSAESILSQPLSSSIGGCTGSDPGGPAPDAAMQLNEALPRSPCSGGGSPAGSATALSEDTACRCTLDPESPPGIVGASRAGSEAAPAPHHSHSSSCGRESPASCRSGAGPPPSESPPSHPPAAGEPWRRGTVAGDSAFGSGRDGSDQSRSWPDVLASPQSLGAISPSSGQVCGGAVLCSFTAKLASCKTALHQLLQCCRHVMRRCGCG